MGNRPAQLLARLDAIGASLARSEEALALLGLGSVGTDLERLDEYSDLDFFVVVQPGAQQAFIEDLTWLQDVASITFSFQNSGAGCKVLFEDGIYAEFAVFDLEELANIPIAGGRIVWQRNGTTVKTADPLPHSTREGETAERLLGEILTNLYVGLMRLGRGERLSAQRFIQGYAVDRVLQLFPLLVESGPGTADSYDASRRTEQRFPRSARYLPEFVQGYDRSVESALAILQFVEGYFPVNAAIAARIRESAQTITTGE